jgi:hypothetical protein
MTPFTALCSLVMTTFLYHHHQLKTHIGFLYHCDKQGTYARANWKNSGDGDVIFHHQSPDLLKKRHALSARSPQQDSGYF